MVSSDQDLLDTLTEKIVDACRYVQPADVERDEDGGCVLILRAAVGPDEIEGTPGDGDEARKEESA